MIRDHFASSYVVYRDIVALQKHMPLNNFVVMNVDTRLGLETAASCIVQWTLVGIPIALLYKPVLR